MFREGIKNVFVCYFLFTCVQAPGYSAKQHVYVTDATSLGNILDNVVDTHIILSKIDLEGCNNEGLPNLFQSTILLGKKNGDVFLLVNETHMRQTTQDLPNTKANTLGDDADDIQKQLDNEAKDRMKFIRPQTIWILHYPTDRQRVSTSTESMGKSDEMELQIKRTTCSCHFGCNENNISYIDIVTKLLANTKGWNYKDQFRWKFTYPWCGGSSQSPVNIPFHGLLRTKAPRPMLYSMYNAVPKSMRLVRRGATVVLFGNWGCNRPVIYGGAAHSRRYVFHSLAIRQPSEHTVGGLYYPMETQALHVSVEYETLEDAISASARDKLALLAISNIYRHSNYSHKGLKELVNSSLWTSYIGVPMRPLPLSVFCPPLKQYAAYHGSLTTPPCTESVLWMVSAKPLPITRELVDIMEKRNVGQPGHSRIRLVQPLNDRKIYFFD